MTYQQQIYSAMFSKSLNKRPLHHRPSLMSNLNYKLNQLYIFHQIASHLHSFFLIPLSECLSATFLLLLAYYSHSLKYSATVVHRAFSYLQQYKLNRPNQSIILRSSHRSAMLGQYSRGSNNELGFRRYLKVNGPLQLARTQSFPSRVLPEPVNPSQPNFQDLLARRMLRTLNQQLIQREEGKLFYHKKFSIEDYARNRSDVKITPNTSVINDASERILALNSSQENNQLAARRIQSFSAHRETIRGDLQFGEKSKTANINIKHPDLKSSGLSSHVQGNGPLLDHLRQIHDPNIILNHSEGHKRCKARRLKGRSSQKFNLHDHPNLHDRDLQTQKEAAILESWALILGTQQLKDNSPETILNLVKNHSMADKHKLLQSRVLENLYNDDSNSSDSHNSPVQKQSHLFSAPIQQITSSLMHCQAKSSLRAAQTQKILIAFQNQDGDPLVNKTNIPRTKILEESKENPDEDLVFRVTLKSLSKKSSSKPTERQDVLVKTIFRIFRQTYKKKLDEVLGKRRKNKPRPEIITSLDKMTEILLSRGVLRCPEQSTTREKLAEYMGALIMPKALQIQMPKESSNRRDAKRPPTIASEIQVPASSLEVEDGLDVYPASEGKAHRAQRIQTIFMIARDTHKVLYKYNKLNLKSFFNFRENVMILEYFLTLAQKVLIKGGPLEKYTASPHQAKAKSSQQSAEAVASLSGSAADPGENINDQTKSEVLELQQNFDIELLTCKSQIQLDPSLPHLAHHSTEAAAADQNLISSDSEDSDESQPSGDEEPHISPQTLELFAAQVDKLIEEVALSKEAWTRASRGQEAPHRADQRYQRFPTIPMQRPIFAAPQVPIRNSNDKLQTGVPEICHAPPLIIGSRPAQTLGDRRKMMIGQKRNAPE